MSTVKKTTKSSLKTPEKAPTLKVGAKVPNGGTFAIIETGGKQYRVAVGDSIKVEKILARTQGGGRGEFKEGDSISFDKVLLVDNGKDATDIGTPYVSGAKVSATLVEIGRHPKITVIKYKQKSRYFKKNGHRQPYFKVKIDKIS